VLGAGSKLTSEQTNEPGALLEQLWVSALLLEIGAIYRIRRRRRRRRWGGRRRSVILHEEVSYDR